ncbi:MAG: hypothetical protein JO002_09800, partial [Burkholderiaceae bacterium]|nr:hypothetical protein [Burkholderiaceae bacterium]
MNSRWMTCTALLALSLNHAWAADPAIGEYITEKGWGILKVTGKPGALHFDIAAIGANGHSCSIEGSIKDGKAVLDDSSPDDPCHVRFQADSAGIDVVLGATGECRQYCGMRAGFDGRYLAPATGCRNRERKAAQGNFVKQYGIKNYQSALNGLLPVLNGCAATLFWLEEAQIRNDLAVTLYHLGRKEDCLAMLGP